MQRTLPAVLIALLLLAAGAWWYLGNDAAPPVVVPTAETQESGRTEGVTAEVGANDVVRSQGAQREAVEGAETTPVP